MKTCYVCGEQLKNGGNRLTAALKEIRSITTAGYAGILPTEKLLAAESTRKPFSSGLF